MCSYAVSVGCLNLTLLRCCQNEMEAISLPFVAAHWNSMIPPPPPSSDSCLLPTIHTPPIQCQECKDFFSKLRTTQLWVCSYSEQESNALVRPNECFDVPVCSGYFLMDCWLDVWFWTTFFFPHRDLSVYIPRLLWLTAAVSEFPTPAL